MFESCVSSLRNLNLGYVFFFTFICIYILVYVLSLIFVCDMRYESRFISSPYIYPVVLALFFEITFLLLMNILSAFVENQLSFQVCFCLCLFLESLFCSIDILSLPIPLSCLLCFYTLISIEMK